ncbi:MAG TPA: DeoR/GlpR family transcriptional regulator [Verrucomicrobiae bacterium]|jgi:DeoR family transcriptional regulator, glycerol-3-phosphate regulon repressor|nr:DeoR/GlpR family transcriptional regulator [Verrucomicrobiae bacterium]
MNHELRHEQILDLVRQRGFVSVEALAEHFDVTPQTIRRDVNLLCSQERLRRYHGGAGLPSSVENTAYQARQVHCLEEKRRIAQLVARHIPDDASLFINIGTTTEEVARALLRHRGLRVITNNLQVASILSQNEDFEVIVAGGVVRSRDRGVVGETTIDFLGQFKVDFGIIGISGIDVDGSLLDFDHREVRASRCIIANSRQIFLVTDHTKFGRRAMVRLGSLQDIDAIFTDRRPPASIVAKLGEHSVVLHMVDELADDNVAAMPPAAMPPVAARR